METEGEEEEGGWQVNFKDVETMKRIIQECFCSRFVEYDSDEFPHSIEDGGGNETLLYADDYEGGWGEEEGVSYGNYTGSQLCSMWRMWDTGSAAAGGSSIDATVYVRAFFVISLVGLLGNATSLIVLLVIGMQQSSSGRIKRVARHGLMALAASDALVCATALPVGVIDRFPFSTSFGFSTVYAAYGEAVMSVFITSSTWITVTMSAGRYFAICSPFRARDVIGDSNAKRCVAAIVVFSLLTNVPRFWWMSVESVDCAGQLFYFRWFGVLGLENDTAGGKVYFWLYSVLIIFLPLVLLVVSSVCLVRKLRQSTSVRFFDAGSRLPSSSSSSSSSSTRYISARDFQITVTLITIATIHVMLVSPAEVLSFLRIADLSSGLQSVFNTMQVTNFTLNFLLYAVLNSSFRRTLLHLVRCRLLRWRIVKRSGSGGGGGGGGRGRGPHCHPLLSLQSYVNVPESVNRNATLPVDDVINTCL